MTQQQIKAPPLRPPRESDFTSHLRSATVAARVGAGARASASRSRS